MISMKLNRERLAGFDPSRPNGLAARLKASSTAALDPGAGVFSLEIG